MRFYRTFSQGSFSPNACLWAAAPRDASTKQKRRHLVPELNERLGSFRPVPIACPRIPKRVGESVEDVKEEYPRQDVGDPIVGHAGAAGLIHVLRSDRVGIGAEFVD